MTEQEKKRLREQIAANERANEERIQRANRELASSASRFASKVQDYDSSYRSMLQQTATESANHQSKMNLTKSAFDANNHQANVLHAEKLKEQAKGNARELEALRNYAAEQEKSLLEQQSEEKKRQEQLRRQLDKEITEQISTAHKERETTQLMTSEEERNRVEYKQDISEKHNAMQKEMKNLELAAHKEENDRRIQHAETQKAIGFAQVNSRIGMNNAEHRVQQNRRFAEDLNAIGNEVTTHRRKFNDISSKVTVANKIGKPELLKTQYTMILRSLQHMKESGTSAGHLISDFITFDIDKNDEDRRAVLELIKKELDEGLSVFYAGIEILAPQKDDYVEEKFLKAALDFVNNAKENLESIKTYWDTVPPIDTTNLVHQEFLSITNQITSGSMDKALYAQPKNAPVMPKEDNAAIEDGVVDEDP